MTVAGIQNKPVVRESTVQPWSFRHLTQGSHQYTKGWAYGKLAEVYEAVSGSPESAQNMNEKNALKKTLV